MTLSELSLAIVPEIGHEHHVLIHLMLSSIRHTPQGILERLLGNLHEMTALAACLLDLTKRVHDFLAGVIVCSGQNTLTQNLVAMRQNAFDELASVVGGVEERNGCVVRGGEGQHVLVFRRVGVWVQHPTREVGHVESGHEEGSGDGKSADVFLDFGFGVKVLNTGVFTIGDWN